MFKLLLFICVIKHVTQHINLMLHTTITARKKSVKRRRKSEREREKIKTIHQNILCGAQQQQQQKRPKKCDAPEHYGKHGLKEIA